MTRFVDVFKKWLQTTNKQSEMDFLESFAIIYLIKSRDPKNFKTALNGWEECFLLILRPMSVCWHGFSRNVPILLDFIKSKKIGDRLLYLQASERMLKWFLAYDHANNSCHFKYFWTSQNQLQDSHPIIREEFMERNFLVKRTIGTFNMLPPKQVIQLT